MLCCNFHAKAKRGQAPFCTFGSHALHSYVHRRGSSVRSGQLAVTAPGEPRRNPLDADRLISLIARYDSAHQSGIQ